jgi:GNAT superfamily N-acetyltransferase
MFRTAIAIDDQLDQLVQAFQETEQTPGDTPAMWNLVSKVNGLVGPAGRNLRHFVELEGRWLAFPTCRRARGFIQWDPGAKKWRLRQGSGRLVMRDLEPAVAFLVMAVECAVAGIPETQADLFLDALYAQGTASPAANEVVLFDQALVSMEQVGDAAVKLRYLWLDPRARGQGLGHRVLSLIERLADQYCCDVWLMAQSFRIPDQYSRDLDTDPGENLVETDQLVRLYRAHGFQGPARHMLREPRCRTRA